MTKRALRPFIRLGLQVRAPWVLFAFFILTLFPLNVGKSMAAMPVPTELKSGSMPVLAYMEAIVDETGLMQIEQVQSEAVQNSFRLFEPKRISEKQGALWLKLSLAPHDIDAENPAHALLLDMGQGIGANPKLYTLEKNPNTEEVQWNEHGPSQGSVFLLPLMESNAQSTQDIYIRLEGIPGIWFAPYLRTPHNMATSYELFAKPAVIVALFVVMLLCLLRGFTEKGQWRYWAALYTGVNLYYAFYGVPINGLSYVPMTCMLQAMAPGVALILFAHVGRHILRGAQGIRSYTIQFILLTLVGIGIALLPLLPGFAWTVRYLDLWPMLMLLFIPTALGAWISGIAGAKRYLVACILPPMGVAIALLGLYEPAYFESMNILPASMLSALALCGLALGTLVLAGTTSMNQDHLENEDNAYTSIEETIETLLQQDPNLRLVPVGEAQSDGESAADIDGGDLKKFVAELEEQLRWPVEQLLREVAALESGALSTEARENAVSIVNATREICGIINDAAKNHMSRPSLGGTETRVFDLQSILREAHDAISTMADKKNISLSWFMQPDLAPCYKGDALQLLFVLRLLLESAVRSTHRGAVHLNVRRVPESGNAGHLLFTVTDSGTGKPPYDRSVTALARAWELSASYRGFLGLESNALGASISFTVHYEVCTKMESYPRNNAQEGPLPIILVSDNVEERQMWGFFLEKMPKVLEARNSEEALELFNVLSASLIIFDARMQLGHIYGIMNGLEQISMGREEEFPICMAIYMDAELEKPLLDMGFSYLFAMPVTRKQLYEAVEEILQRHGDGSQPAQESEAASSDSSTVQGVDSSMMQVNEDKKEDSSMHVENQMMPEKKEVQGGEEEIIDTGLPILEMAKSPQKSTKAQSSNKSGMPEINIGPENDLPQEEEQVGDSKEVKVVNFENDGAEQQAVAQDIQETTQDVRNDSLSDAIFMPLTEVETASGSEHENFYGQQELYSGEHSLFSSYTQYTADDLEALDRPLPSQDKSNSAYLTAFLDTGDSKNDAEEAGKVDMEKASGEKQATPASVSDADSGAPKILKKSSTVKKKKAHKEKKSTEEKNSVEKNPDEKPKLRISTKKSAAANVQDVMHKDETVQEEAGQEATSLVATSLTQALEQNLVQITEQTADNAESSTEQISVPNIAFVPASEQKEEKKKVVIKKAPKIKEIKSIDKSVSTAQDADQKAEDVMDKEQVALAQNATAQEAVNQEKQEQSITNKITQFFMPKKKEEQDLTIQTADDKGTQNMAEHVEWVGEPTPIQKNNVVVRKVSKVPQGASSVKSVVKDVDLENKTTSQDVKTEKQLESNQGKNIADKITSLFTTKKKTEEESKVTAVPLNEEKEGTQFLNTAKQDSHEEAEWVGEPMPVTEKKNVTIGAEQKTSPKKNIVKKASQRIDGEVYFEQPTEKTKPSIKKKINVVKPETKNAQAFTSEQTVSRQTSQNTFEEKTIAASTQADKHMPELQMPVAEKKIIKMPKMPKMPKMLKMPKMPFPRLGDDIAPLSMSGTEKSKSEPQGKSSKRIIDDAEMRGREELRHLRSYLDSSSALQDGSLFHSFKAMEAVPTKAQQTTIKSVNMSTVGEPSPVQHQGKEMGNYNLLATKPMTKTHSLSPIEQLLEDLDVWLSDANTFYLASDAAGVEDAAGKMAQSADSLGLRTLARLARTVESAAKAQDITALGDLLPELDNSIQRNRAALRM